MRITSINFADSVKLRDVLDQAATAKTWLA